MAVAKAPGPKEMSLVGKGRNNQGKILAG